jgi:predicted transcriptional regulator
MAPYDQPMADDHNDRPGADHTDDEKLLVLPLGEESKLITQTIANDTARQILELLADGALSTSAIAKKLEIPLTTAQYNAEKLIEAKLVIVEKTKYSEKGREVKLYAPARRMIVLVPANTSRQAVMDVLKRYLVLVPLAGFVALMVELAMAFLNRSPAAKGTDGNSPLLSAQGANLSAIGATDVNTWNSAPAYAPELTGPKSMTRNISGHVSGTNETFGVGYADPGMYATPPNATLPVDNATGGYGIYTPAMNRSMETVSGANAPLPQPTGAPSGSSHGLIPADPLNHFGLWFFVGCLAIIGVMIAYELYRGRSKK